MTYNQHFKSLGRLKPGQMNKTEAKYSLYLESERQRGAVLWFKFGAIKLRLADNTFYSTDFAVLTAALEMELHDVKPRKGDGYFAMEDSKMKIKIAADMYPFRFFIAFPDRVGNWNKQEF